MIDPVGWGNVVGEYTDNSLDSRYIYGLGGLIGRVDANNTEYFFDTDELGTVVGLSNAAGVYEKSYVFDPFGNGSVPSFLFSPSGSMY